MVYYRGYVKVDQEKITDFMIFTFSSARIYGIQLTDTTNTSSAFPEFPWQRKSDLKPPCIINHVSTL